MNDPTIRRVLIVFGLAAVAVLLIATVTVRNLNREAASSDWVNHTHAVLSELQSVSANLRAGEASLRTFVFGGGRTDRLATRDAFDRLEEHVGVLQALMRNEAQSAQADNIATLVGRRLEFANSILKENPAPGDADTVAKLARDNGLAAIAEIERATAKLRDEQMTLLAERDRLSVIHAQSTRWTVWTGVAVNFLLLAGAVWLIRDDIAARKRVAAVLAEANDQLEVKVRERTQELATANEHLAAENLERRWANEALEHQIHYNQVIVNSINDAVFVLTKSLNISRINPAVVHLTGYDAPQLVNRPLNSIVHLASDSATPHEQLFDPILQALKEGRDLRDLPAETEDRLKRRNKVTLTVFPLQDGAKVVGGIAIVRPLHPLTPAS